MVVVVVVVAVVLPLVVAVVVVVVVRRGSSRKFVGVFRSSSFLTLVLTFTHLFVLLCIHFPLFTHSSLSLFVHFIVLFTHLFRPFTNSRELQQTPQPISAPCVSMSATAWYLPTPTKSHELPSQLALRIQMSAQAASPSHELPRTATNCHELPRTATNCHELLDQLSLHVQRRRSRSIT